MAQDFDITVRMRAADAQTQQLFNILSGRRRQVAALQAGEFPSLQNALREYGQLRAALETLQSQLYRVRARLTELRTIEKRDEATKQRIKNLTELAQRRQAEILAVRSQMQTVKSLVDLERERVRIQEQQTRQAERQEAAERRELEQRRREEERLRREEERRQRAEARRAQQVERERQRAALQAMMPARVPSDIGFLAARRMLAEYRAGGLPTTVSAARAAELAAYRRVTAAQRELTAALASGDHARVTAARRAYEYARAEHQAARVTRENVTNLRRQAGLWNLLNSTIGRVTGTVRRLASSFLHVYWTGVSIFYMLRNLLQPLENFERSLYFFARRALSEFRRGVAAAVAKVKELEASLARARALFGPRTGTRFFGWAVQAAIGTPYEATEIMSAARMAQAMRLTRFIGIEQLITRVAGPLSLVFREHLERGMEDVVYGIGRALTGYWRILRRMGIMPEELSARYGTPMPGTAAARTEAGQRLIMTAIAREVEARYGGFAEQFGGTWEVLLRDLSDIWTVFVMRYEWDVENDRRYRGTITDLLKRLLQGFRDTFLRWIQTGQLDKFLNALRRLTQWMEPLVSWLIDKMGGSIDMLTSWLERLEQRFREWFTRKTGLTLDDLLNPRVVDYLWHRALSVLTYWFAQLSDLLKVGLHVQYLMYDALLQIFEIIGRAAGMDVSGIRYAREQMQAWTVTILQWLTDAYWRLMQYSAMSSEQARQAYEGMAPQAQQPQAQPPQYQTGGYVERTGQAWVHAGEYVLSPEERQALEEALGRKLTREEIESLAQQPRLTPEEIRRLERAAKLGYGYEAFSRYAFMAGVPAFMIPGIGSIVATGLWGASLLGGIRSFRYHKRLSRLLEKSQALPYGRIAERYRIAQEPPMWARIAEPIADVIGLFMLGGGLLRGAARLSALPRIGTRARLLTLARQMGRLGQDEARQYFLQQARALRELPWFERALRGGSAALLSVPRYIGRWAIRHPWQAAKTAGIYSLVVWGYEKIQELRRRYERAVAESRMPPIVYPQPYTQPYTQPYPQPTQPEPQQAPEAQPLPYLPKISGPPIIPPPIGQRALPPGVLPGQPAPLSGVGIEVGNINIYLNGEYDPTSVDDMRQVLEEAIDEVNTQVWAIR